MVFRIKSQILPISYRAWLGQPQLYLNFLFLSAIQPHQILSLEFAMIFFCLLALEQAVPSAWDSGHLCLTLHFPLLGASHSLWSASMVYCVSPLGTPILG